MDFITHSKELKNIKNNDNLDSLKELLNQKIDS